MKIDGLSNIYALRPMTRSTRTAQAPAAGPASVGFSGSAEWVRGLKAQGQVDAAPRADVIAEMKAALADGSFESSVDMRKVVDGLLGEL
ncbi:MAG: anti-sigma28 factor (negative regulator of flagellin synthesis) [Cognaticolwellia sp.]|jgi:anti-sigma28 factor (negative regulator of flagellin synthesis)